ncbi:MAG: hypothetical protein ACHQ15_07280 [Candidatus Limnocylindrales bacterium]
MVFRIGLFVASLAASFGLAGALSLAGLAPHPGAPAATATATSETQVAAAPQPPLVQVDTVYLVAPEPTTIVVHKQARKSSGSENEGGDDDGG